MTNEYKTLLARVQKPGRYTGGELHAVVKDKNEVDVRFAFCFPDTYEVGMSHLGMKILYAQFNAEPYIWCERVFAPWVDFEAQLRGGKLPLYALESGDPLTAFDIIGFTLQYELCYTNVLNMLDLAGIPLRAADRETLAPLVVAGGPCACNPEPLAPFVDVFFLGEGEEVDLEFLSLYRAYKKRGETDKQEFLREAAKIPGVYVPSLYDVSYHTDGTVQAVVPHDGAPARVRKRTVSDLDKSFYPDTFVVPNIEIIHDRAVEEVFRGCIRGCRFCQAGFLCRPVREKLPQTVLRQAQALCESTGYETLSLSSLSTSDYTSLPALLDPLLDWAREKKISLSLPSLRIDNFPQDLLEKLHTGRATSLTFAPEAGTQRLRDVINKNITEEEILETCNIAFMNGYTNVKLYFMMGLPTETDEDIRGIAQLGQRIVDLYYHSPKKPKGKSVNVSISVAVFVPKPFTPFMFEAQDAIETIRRKQQVLIDSVTTRKISLSWHDAQTSFLEAVFALGDRRLADVLETAWRLGCRFDSWGECFSMERWLRAFDTCRVDSAFYANRRRTFDECLPWEHLDYGVDKSFFIRENQKAQQGITTPHCREACAHCGAARFGEGLCVEQR